MREKKKLSLVEKDRKFMDEFFMKMALQEARRAFEEQEVPIGAVIVHEGNLVAKAHNQRETLKDPTAHAEILAMTQAASALESWRLSGCTIYVTLEPCPMCAGALIQGRVDRLVFGAWDPKGGACGSLWDLLTEKKANHKVEVTPAILETDCGAILSEFFRLRRKSKPL